MTRKDYNHAAQIIKDLPGLKSKVIYTFVTFFTSDNPRFDEERFVRACYEIKTEKEKSQNDN